MFGFAFSYVCHFSLAPSFIYTQKSARPTLSPALPVDMAKDIKELAEEWLRLDEDKSTTDEIYRLLVDGDTDELEKRLRTRIAFGTAGLRGPMKAGFACMNSLTVIQASQGLAAYLLKTEHNVKHRGVVIGRDARHNSEKFAKLTASAFVAKGIKVWCKCYIRSVINRHLY